MITCFLALVSGGTVVLSVLLCVDHVLFSAGLWWDWCPFGVDHVLVSAGLWWDCCPFCFVVCRLCAFQRWFLAGLFSFLV